MKENEMNFAEVTVEMKLNDDDDDDKMTTMMIINTLPSSAAFRVPTFSLKSINAAGEFLLNEKENEHRRPKISSLPPNRRKTLRIDRICNSYNVLTFPIILLSN